MAHGSNKKNSWLLCYSVWVESTPSIQGAPCAASCSCLKTCEDSLSQTDRKLCGLVALLGFLLYSFKVTAIDTVLATLLATA